VRASRGQRPEPGRQRLVDRDLELLHAVARLKVATSKQLATLLFGDASSLHRRVRALHGLGYVDVVVVGLNNPNLVALTPRGARLLETTGMRAGDIHVARRIERLDPHAELIGDLWVGFERLARARPELAIDVVLDHDLRRALGPAQRRAYVPDAIVSFEDAAGETVAIAYEVDRGHEPVGEIGKKIATTLELRASATPLYGYARWRPVLLVPSLARARTLARRACELGAGDLWVLGLLETRLRPDAPEYATAEAVMNGAALRQRLIPEVSLPMSSPAP
jgi:hypothetical protein